MSENKGDGPDHMAVGVGVIGGHGQAGDLGDAAPDEKDRAAEASDDKTATEADLVTEVRSVLDEPDEAAARDELAQRAKKAGLELSGEDLDKLAAQVVGPDAG